MPSWLAFERRIIVKQNAPDLVRQLLRAGGTRYSGLLRGESLVIGTATDPYQPAERRYRITRGVLEVLAEATGLSIVIITKSPLVTRDVDVLARISARSRLTVHVSLITLDRDLARRIEPRSPTPESRLRAIARLHEAGIDVGVNCMPVLPGITDRPADLEALVRSVAAAGAQHIGAGSLRLRSTARERYLPFLSAEFPELAERYRAAYAHGHQASDRYRAGLRRFMRDLCARYGIAIREYQQDDVEDVEEDASSDEQRVASGEAPAAAEAQGLVVFRRTPKRVKERVHAAVMETPQLRLAL
jgi:DNA repair photolyase